MTLRLVLVVASLAQHQDTQPPPPPPHVVQWWEVASVVGTVGLASLADRSVNIWTQDHRSSSSDNLASIFRTGGQPAVVFGIGGVITLTGAVSGHDRLRRSGERVLASAIVAGVATAAIKLSVGRLRPDTTDDPYIFKPFSGNDAFPSGHATLAFALATSLSHEIHNSWVSAGMYTFAAGTAWSRLNDQRHWLSDVLMGTAIGVTGAKLIDGEWRVFGLAPPKFLIEPGGARLEWRARF
ncbi:MAG TPA: phosphatase PAP2 family protein [Gemmatimonadales bacterium]|nr:phosphatase PAP2 family protein [Gemmatimonadales bacterium]